MNRLKEYKEIVIISLVILSFSFYWFQLRPTNIKKRCSWITEMQKGSPFIPAFPGVTKEEAEKKNIECNKKQTFFGCNYSEESPRQAIPAGQDKEVTRRTSDSEYKNCLRDNGL